ncbi:MAG TPA: hypothetical protein VG146_22290 [Verrucomicrobiae bacterium]|nr:hypothetical protein [Verrucomicrobiae bacterium]
MKNHIPHLQWLNSFCFEATTAARHWRGVALAILLLLAGKLEAGAQTYSLTTTWQATNGTPGAHLATGDVNRGLAFSVLSNQVFVANKGVTGSGTTPAIDVFDGATGSLVGNADTTGISGGTFWLDQVAVADDGVFYGANLTTAVGSTAYRLYRWPSWMTVPANVFAGDPTGGATIGKRIGDNLAVTGAGTATLILAPVESGTVPTTNVVLFSTLDGTNFNPTLVNISGLPPATGGPVFGIAFFTNNTFLFKPNGAAIYLVQFPVDFASQSSPVTATVVATNAFSGNNLILSFDSVSRFLGAVTPASSGTTLVNLYTLQDFVQGLNSVASTNFASPNANGNLTGGAALGGQGKTNFIYALDTNNGLVASRVNFTAAAVAPAITTEPVGGTVYTNAPSFTFTVAASGSAPLAYQWQFNTVSNVASAANINGATNTSYTLTYPPTSASGWYDVVVTNLAGATSSIPAQLIVVPPASSGVVTQLWSLAPGFRPYLGGADTYDTRGLAYDGASNTVLVADKNIANFGVFVLDGDTGADLFALNTLGIGQPGNQFDLDQVGVADDGVAYAGNLTLAGSGANFGLVSWPSVSASAAPYQAYAGDPGNGSEDRWGDTMAVRGAGASTEILLGSYSGFGGGPATNVALLTTSDGQNFSATTLAISNVPAGFSSLGIAFGAGNTFWAKSPGYDLRQIAFDQVAGTGTVVADYPAATSGISSFSSMSSIGLDAMHGILGGITFNDVPNDLALYQISTNGIPPYLFDQDFFPSLNGNVQENGVTVIRFPRIYALDVNNGVLALSYGVPPPPPLPPFSISGIIKGVSVTLTWPSYSGRSYQVMYKNALTDPSWTALGAPIVATGTTSSFTDTSAGGAARFYRIQGQ